MARPSGIIASSERVDTASGCVDGGRSARGEVAQDDEAYRGEGQERPRVEALQPRPHDQQDGKEADADCGPAAHAHRLAERNRGDGRRGERHDLQDRRGIGDLQVRQGGQIEGSRPDLSYRPKSEEALCQVPSRGKRPLVPGEGGEHGRRDQTADDDDLADRQICAHELHKGIAKGESGHRGEHE